MEINDLGFKEKILSFLKEKVDLNNIKSIILAMKKDDGDYIIDFVPKQDNDFDFNSPLYKNKEMSGKELSGYENSSDIAVIHIDQGNNMQLSSDIDFKSEDVNMIKDEKTIKEKLIEEFTAAIADCFGDNENQPYEKGKVANSDIATIANKVKFYMDEDLINDSEMKDEQEVQMSEEEIEKILGKSIDQLDKLSVIFNGNNINIKGEYIPFGNLNGNSFVEEGYDEDEGGRPYRTYSLQHDYFSEAIREIISKHYNIDDIGGELVVSNIDSKSNIGYDGNVWFDFNITLSLIPDKDLALKEAREQNLVENKK